jgi:hypothetical protein
MVTDSTMIDVDDITRINTDLPSGYGLAEVPQTNADLWYANGVVGGNERTGQILKSPYRPLLGTRSLIGTYRAPKTLPDINPVIIELEIYKKTRKGKELRKRLTCWILVYDAYRVKMEYEFTGRPGMGSKLVDSASFRIEFYSEDIKLEDIRNYPPQTLKEGRHMGITEKIFLDAAPGPINIRPGTKNYSFTRGSPSEVYFEFTETPVLYYTIQYLAPRFHIETEKVTISCKSLPETFRFYTKRELQEFVHPENKNLRIIITPGEPGRD